MSRSALIFGLVGWLALCFAVVNLGLFWTETGEQSWYAHLRKPSWTPPGWVFGPVWFLNCVLMGVAAWLVWKGHGFAGAGVALGLFLGQLLIAGLFTPVFFGAQSTLGGMLIMLATLALLVAAIIAMIGKSPTAAMLLLPYLAWIALATSVAIGLWVMNRP